MRSLPFQVGDFSCFQAFRNAWGRKRSSTIEVLKFLCTIGLLTMFLAHGTQELGYNWQWYRVPQYFAVLRDGKFTAGPLLRGLVITIHICVVSSVLAFVVGLLSAMCRLSRSCIPRAAARCYIEAVRNTPLLIQIFFIYFVISPALSLSRFESAVLSLSLFEGAYASEIIRGGIVSVEQGHWEAAYSLGLSKYHTYIHIILPQAVRRMLPPLTNQTVSLVKDSALVSTISIYDLTMEGQVIVADTFMTFEIWFTVAAIYLAINVGLSSVVFLLEQRLVAKNQDAKGG